jgi:tetratricopeptide (TPR) repeat protein
VTFVAGLTLLAAVLLGGFARVAMRDHALPGLAQDPLLEASRMSGRGDGAGARAEFAAAVGMNTGDDNMMLQAGAGLRAAGHHADAEAALRKALAIRARASTHAQLGWTLMQAHRLDEAAASFATALQMDPSDPLALAGMGEIRLTGDRYAEAAEFFRRSIAAKTPDAALLNSYGIALALGGNGASAVQAFELAARLDPTPDILANLARARATAPR